MNGVYTHLLMVYRFPLINVGTIVPATEAGLYIKLKERRQRLAII